jgi:hypothetical protein
MSCLLGEQRHQKKTVSIYLTFGRSGFAFFGRGDPFDTHFYD